MEIGVYYLKIKTKDGNGNISEDSWDAFVYSYNGVSPYLYEEITSRADFEEGTLDQVSSTGVTDSIRLQSKSGFWNETRLSNAPASIYRGGELVRASYDGTDYLFTFRGNGTTTFYRYTIETDTWEAMADAPAAVNYGGYVISGPEGFLYASQGNNTSTFWKYDIDQNSWEAVSSAPKNFYYGASLSFDGTRYVYAIPGNDDAFYRYDTQNNSWMSMANIDFGNPNTADGQRTYIGSDSNYDGRNNIYVIQGNYYPYLAKYSIADDPEYGETANTWTPLTNAPTGVYEGGSITYDTENEVLYAVRGNWRKNFFKYDVASDSWTELPDTPSTFAYGASLSYHNGYIYATRGANSSNFYRFNIEKNSWEIPQAGFFGPSTVGGGSYLGYYYGSFLANNGDNGFYVIRGYYDNVFGFYDIENGLFTELAKLPVGAYNGASIVYNEDENAVYYTPGDIRTRRSGSGNYFFKYDVADNTWSEITTDRIPDQTTYGSTMLYDGSQYVYLTRGGNSALWWRYDTLAAEGSRWSSALPTISGWVQSYGARIILKDGHIYSVRGGNNATFWRYDINTPGWIQLENVPNSVYIGGDLIDGRDGYLYVIRGNNTNEYYRYNIADSSWETLEGLPAQIYRGGSAGYISNRIWTTAGDGANSYRDGLYSYVVGSETNGTGFEKSGAYLSEAINLLSVYEFANLTIDCQEPEGTSLSVYTRTSDEENPDPEDEEDEDWDPWTAVTNKQQLGVNQRYTIASESKKFIEIKIEFNSSNGLFSSTVNGYTINYYQDISAPENPLTVSAYSNSEKTQAINSSSWYNHGTPYFEWPAADEEGGAFDNEGGSGVAGYYVYFGTQADGEPVDYQTINNYCPTELQSGNTYYLRIQAKDNAENIPGEVLDAFIFKYDVTAPTTFSDISVTPAGYTAIDSFVFLWTNDSSDEDSGILKYQYQAGGDDDLWYDINDPEEVTVTIPNEEHIVGAYQPGKNTFYLRAVDNAGNFSSLISQDFYYSASAPSPPQNLMAVPEYSETNNLSFVWNQPDSFIGDPSKLKYYYSINAKPTAYNTVETTVKAVGPGPFASQKGPNTFYVVAKDEAENIDYELYASVEFVADTSNPPVPGNVQAFDTSDRESQEYSAAIKWSVPEEIDSGNFAGYAIFRSEDDVNFTEVAMTTGSAFVDTGLESKLYYYYVKSKDRTNNYSIASSTVSLIPTGRYTTPPTLVQEPSIEIQSFQATFSWATNRVCSSFIEYGKTISLGETTGQVDSVTDHLVEVNGLSADTKYFYQAKYIDQDGNIGTSEVGNFTTLPPPTISDFVISDIGLTAAVVSYKTNTGGTCTLKYGKGSYSSTNEVTSSSTSHVIKLEELENSTTYQAMADCVDSDGNEFSSDEYTFTTLRQPIVSDAQVQNKENVDIPTVDVYYKTDEDTTTLVKFKKTDESNYHNYLTNENVSEHKATIEGLEPSKEYELILTGISVSGVEAVPQTIRITTKSDSRPPGVTVNRAIGKVVGRGSGAQANMYVKVETDELTNVRIFFGKGTLFENFEQSSAESPFNTYHLITIPVDPGRLYSYIVEAKDEAQNKTITKAVTVVVEEPKNNATEIVMETFSNKFGWLSMLWK